MCECMFNSPNMMVSPLAGVLNINVSLHSQLTLKGPRGGLWWVTLRLPYSLCPLHTYLLSLPPLSFSTSQTFLLRDTSHLEDALCEPVPVGIKQIN